MTYKYLLKLTLTEKNLGSDTRQQDHIKNILFDLKNDLNDYYEIESYLTEWEEINMSKLLICLPI